MESRAASVEAGNQRKRLRELNGHTILTHVGSKTTQLGLSPVLCRRISSDIFSSSLDALRKSATV